MTHNDIEGMLSGPEKKSLYNYWIDSGTREMDWITELQ